MSGLVFRAVAGVVNVAACAVNHLLEVMYPKDIGHIWEDVPAASGGPAPTGPTPGVVADPAGGNPLPPAGSLTWEGWAVPAILDVLAEHRPAVQRDTGLIFCPDGAETAQYYSSWEEWREHVAPIIAARIGCDPRRAIIALGGRAIIALGGHLNSAWVVETGHDIGGRWAAETFPQHTKRGQ